MHDTIDIRIKDIESLVYFILSMFEQEDVHRQGTSSKGDLLGGYIDRWINRISESVVFNNYLLLDKPYDAVNDFFVYSINSAKNAPDIIGIKDDDGRVVKFTEFNETKWESCEDMPFVEVKTFRKSQRMLSVREAQMDKDHYYIMVEADLRSNYLKALFKDRLFKNSIYKNLIMDGIFIKSNNGGYISQPAEINTFDSNEIIGTIKLLSIIKGEDFINLTDLCDEKETVYYVKDINEVSSIRGGSLNKPLKKLLDYDKSSKLCSGIWNSLKLISIHVEKAENIIVKKINKNSIYIETLGICTLDGIKLKKGKFYKIEFVEFQRSSNWREYIAHKNTFCSNIDRTNELIDEFDRLYKMNWY